MSEKTKIIILGGGFGGVYTALELEKIFKNGERVEITLVNKDNFLLFTPMLHEVAASDLDAANIVNPIHKLLSFTKFFCGSVDHIDTENRSVSVSHGEEHHSHVLEYDHLVVALGSVTHFYGLPGLAENALTMKSLGDALCLRNKMIALFEEADFECCKHLRESLLTFVVAGSGFAGVETAAAMHDFVQGVVKFYPNLRKHDVRVVLISSGKTVLPELSPKLGGYAARVLQQRGVEIFFETKVTSYLDGVATLANGTKIKCCTLVWTAGNAANPLVSEIDCRKEKGRLLVDENLLVRDQHNVWALGDCAAVPNGHSGEFHPPTAQHAIREAKTVARNIAAAMEGKPPKAFRFKTLGQLASIGHHKGVAQIFGMRFSGFIAWWMWRSIYLMKLPRLERKIRVALDWTLDVVFSKDNVQLPTVTDRDAKRAASNKESAAARAA